jgi:hypothetical protein
MIAETSWTAAKKFRARLSVAGRNGLKVLNFMEEALDEVALAVTCEIAVAFDRSVGFGGNYGRDFSLGKALDQRISVVGLVCDQGFRIGIFNHKSWICPAVASDWQDCPRHRRGREFSLLTRHAIDR